MASRAKDVASEPEAAKVASRSPKEYYDEVVSRATLLAVQVQSLKFDVTPAYRLKRDGNKFGYSFDVVEVKFDPDRGFASLKVVGEVTVKRARAKMLHIHVEYDIGYNGMEGCDPDATEAFLRRVGPFTGWPYFRSLVASLDWNAGTGLQMLPVLRERVHPPTAKAPVAQTKDD